MVQRLLEQYADKFGLSVSTTTREPREGEEEGSAPQSLDLLDQIVVVRHMLTPAPATPKLLHDIVGARGNPLRARGPSGDPWSNTNSVDYF